MLLALLKPIYMWWFYVLSEPPMSAAVSVVVSAAISTPVGTTDKGAGAGTAVS